MTKKEKKNGTGLKLLIETGGLWEISVENEIEERIPVFGDSWKINKPTGISTITITADDLKATYLKQ